MKISILFEMKTIFSLDNTSDLIFFIFDAFSERKITLFRVDIWFSDYPIKILCFFFLYKIWKIFIFSCFIHQQEISMYLTDYTRAIFFELFI